jgi:lipid-A-disaccharide synthase
VREVFVANECADKKPSILVIAGDPSADKHVGKLLLKLKQSAPDLSVWGMGSTAMENAGAELLFDCKDLSSVGIIGVIKLKPFVDRVSAMLLTEIKNRKPKLVLLVDFGGFNLPFSEAVRTRFPDLKILYFISPQVWGSRPWRIKTIARNVSKMLVIFPFEETLYRSRGVPVRFVGHPLIADRNDKDPIQVRHEFFSKYSLDESQPLVAVFPGSRKSEIPSLFPVVWQAMQRLTSERPGVQFAISLANQERAKAIQNIIDKDKEHANASIRFVNVPSEENDDLIAASEIVWAKSGTTALEVALHGKPMLVFYRADWLSYWLFLAFKQVQKISLPNLLAGKTLVPELIQLDCRPDQLVKYTRDLLDVPALRLEIGKELLALREQLGEGDFATACTEEILDAIRIKDQLVKH